MEKHPHERLREFINEHLSGGCKILSKDKCDCPRCDLDALIGALRFYGQEAHSLHHYLKNDKPEAVMATVTVLSLDAGQRARAAIGPWPTIFPIDEDSSVNNKS